ncbi:hypothetical protein F4819DRAFT_481595 [Hypoxylon fuscum]|nr:hypothetical protein F4819DRAFT_481595 [Hypoxylon fuscum]
MGNGTRACREGLSGLCSNSAVGTTKGECYIYNGRTFAYPIGRTVLDSERTILQDECCDGLRKEIEKCDRGGSTEYTDWVYTYTVPASFGP